MGNVKISFFNACCTHMNQKMLHACAGFNVQTKAYFVLRWNTDAIDMKHPLVGNTMLSKINIKPMLCPNTTNTMNNVQAIK